MAATPVAAKPISPEAALQRTQSTGQAKIIGNTKPVLAKTFEADGQATMYLYDKGNANGFMLLSADDQFPALLGYSDNQEFSTDNLAPGLLWLIEEYGREITWSRQQNCISTSPEIPYREPVEPLIATKWNQDFPYNIKCPVIGTTKAPVGCVATAMAQVLYYHRCPSTHGSGNWSYDMDEDHSFSYDYENTVFDWDNMPLSFPYEAKDYPSGDEEVINNAVAELSVACGISVNMLYDSSQSGALSHRLARALVENFGYDPSLVYRDRTHYTLTEWNNLIYNEVANRRPVLYAGNSNIGGHQFICDGYSENNFFHINWGWGGQSDGYYLLSLLDPPIQGIGGSGDGSGFSFGQDAIVGIQPANEGSEISIPFYAKGGFTSFYDRNSWQQAFTFKDSGALNYHVNDFDVYVGLRIENEDGESQIIYYDTTTHLQGTGEKTTFHGIGGFYAPYKKVDLAEGRYKAYPTYKEINSDNWTDILTPAGTPRFVWLNVDSKGRFKFEDSEETETAIAWFTEFSCQPTPYSNNPTFILKLFNDGEVPAKGYHHACIGNENRDVLASIGFNVDALPQIPFTIQFEWNPWLAPGDYKCWVIDETGNPASDIMDITIPDYLYPIVNISSVQIPDEFFIGKATSVKMEIANEGTLDFYDELTFIISDPETVEPLQEIKTTWKLPKGESQLRSLKITPEVAEGVYDFAAYNNNNQRLSDVYKIKVADYNGVDGIADYDEGIFDVYTIQGVRIASGITESGLGDIPAGIYIKKTASTAEKLVIR